LNKNLSAFTDENIINTTDKRIQNRKETHATIIEDINNKEKNMKTTMSSLLKNDLNKQATTLSNLLKNLIEQGKQLNVHNSTISETTNLLTLNCNETKDELLAIKNEMSDLKKLNKNLMQNVKNHTKSISSLFLNDINDKKIENTVVNLLNEQKDELASTIEETINLTTAHTTTMTEDLNIMKDTTLSNLTKEYNQQQSELNDYIENTLTNGRRGNCFESLKISINSNSNTLLDSFKLQRDRLTSESSKLKNYINIHNDMSQDISERTNERCDQIMENVTNTLSNARLELATTMDTLNHVVSVHSDTRNNNYKQHEFDLKQLTSNLKMKTKEQKSTLLQQNEQLTQLLEEQRENQRALITNVMDTVRNMLETNVEQMSNTLSTTITSMRNKNEQLIATTDEIDGTMNSGETSLLASTSNWYDMSETSDSTIKNTVHDDIFVLHDDLNELEEQVSGDIHEMVMNVVERSALDATSMKTLGNIEKHLRDEVNKESTSMSTTLINNTENILKENEEWNSNVMDTHNNIIQIKQKSNALHTQYTNTMNMNNNHIDEIKENLNKYQNNNSEKCVLKMKNVLKINDAISKNVVDTKNAIQDHVKTLLHETNDISTVINNGNDIIKNASALNDTLNENIIHNSKNVMKSMKNLQNETNNLLGEKNTYEGEKEEFTNSNMQNTIDKLSNMNNTIAETIKDELILLNSMNESIVQKINNRYTHENGIDNEIISSTKSYMNENATMMNKTIISETNAMNTLLSNTSNTIIDLINEQNTVTKNSNSKINEVLNELEKKTSKSLNDTMMNALNNVTNVMTNHVENVDSKMIMICTILLVLLFLFWKKWLTFPNPIFLFFIQYV